MNNSVGISASHTRIQSSSLTAAGGTPRHQNLQPPWSDLPHDVAGLHLIPQQLRHMMVLIVFSSLQQHPCLSVRQHSSSSRSSSSNSSSSSSSSSSGSYTPAVISRHTAAGNTEDPCLSAQTAAAAAAAAAVEHTSDWEQHDDRSTVHVRCAD